MRDANVTCSSVEVGTAHYNCFHSQIWQSGDQVGTVLQAASLQYPLSIIAITAYLSRFPGSDESVDLRANVYAMSGSQPDALLGSSAVTTFTGPDEWSRGWVTFTLATPIVLTQAQPFVAAIEYVNGTLGRAPSIVSDVSTNLPNGACYYKVSGDVWREHYAFWPSFDAEAQEVGYPPYSCLG